VQREDAAATGEWERVERLRSGGEEKREDGEALDEQRV